jgi:uncharacterized protein YdiU (UPF0061 family)
MAALGVLTTRSLAAVMTGETVWRERHSRRGASRVVQATLRRHLQYLAARRDVDAWKRPADYVIARHYPQAETAPNRYRALLDAVIAAGGTDRSGQIGSSTAS